MEFVSEIIIRENFIIEYGSHIRDALLIILEGQISFHVNGTTYVADENDICIFQKDTLFERKVLKKIKGIYIQFETFPMPLLSGLLKTKDPARTKNTIKHLYNSITEENPQMAEHFLMDILLMYHTPQSVTLPHDPIVSACISFFSQHCAEHITLEMLSERFSISKQGLIKRFKKSTRKTPVEYLIFTRINLGKLLLKDTTLSIGEIAEKCGFENMYYFSNCFKSITKVSPSAYRRSNNH